ncbi:DUF943 family protein [Rahnella ecdela]|uniref:DUF943 family protein n=1 Tax=Rahnella ecdela TaxID=2816250 RepID=A0ABS6LHW7_9GAMM|nr:DUF943 family protein [Rahnella ecdela]MBU9846343.1 DUF943 family protein [Rahnella ecdela]
MNKKSGIFIIFILIIVTCFFVLREPEIIYVHEDEDSTVIIVRNFPITQWGKIYWWENNKDMMNAKYQLPRVDAAGNYYVSILDGSDGFKKVTEANLYWFSFEHTDLYCFNEIKSEDRCIEKNFLMQIHNGMKNKTDYFIKGDYVTK